MTSRTYRIATRGSALALVQANFILGRCRAAFPGSAFELNIIKTTGDKLQAVAPTNTPPSDAGKGLFTKELEVALLNGEADLAVHSLKDLPTELPPGLALGAVSAREDVRDVLIYRDSAHFAAPLRALPAGSSIRDFPAGATVATSSTRRQAQLRALRPDLNTVPIRGNVGTRLQRLAERSDLDGIVLAAAGLNRLGFRIDAHGQILSPEVQPGATSAPVAPPGLIAVHMSVDDMLPCVGQAALGIEVRAGDADVQPLCDLLTDASTMACVLAERSFLRAMGGGCLSPVGAYATFSCQVLRLRAISFRDEAVRRCDVSGIVSEAEALGRRAAAECLGRVGT